MGTFGGHMVVGQRGEKAAEKHLRDRGFNILGRNVRTHAGEIDLIARQGEVIVFVEVKAKSRSDGIFQPSDRVNWKKIKRLQGAAEIWMDERGHRDVPCRVDVVGVCEGKVIEHLEDVSA